MKNFQIPTLSGALLFVVGNGPTAVDANEPAGAGFQDEISYSNDIQPIVKNFCTTCHAGDDPEGDFVLTSYRDVRDHVENGELLDRINDARDPMPEDGLMPNHMRRLFKVWADTGFLENGSMKAIPSSTEYEEFTPPEIIPIDIAREGFELLENLQGHWVGEMNLMGTKYDWMAFDYRPIAPSHVHGIFEAGTIGNLFTSFFVTEFKGKRTIMARNGGILNGIYRTSYFVLDKVKISRGRSYYRLVDAYGGDWIMYMELTFTGKKMEFNAYTSRFGLTKPKRHMAFKAERKRPELASSAAKAVGFPRNVIDFEFPNPMPKPTWGSEYPLTSASYIWEETNKPLIELGNLARDPRRVDQMPYLSQLTVSIRRNQVTQGKKLHVYLSQKALTDEQGRFITRGRYIRLDLLDTLLSFPELSGKANEFTFTYLHPGDYYLTVVADMDGDGYPSPGDISHPVTRVSVAPESRKTVVVNNLEVRN
ncbi:MAG: c-type cytochrome domain-containing protein [Verrucomicrobiota bacterium]